MIFSRFSKFCSLVTVEPTLFLFVLGMMLTTVVEEALFIDKACRVNHGFNDTVCDNISNASFKNFNKEVQVTVSYAHLLKDVVSNTLQIVVALFMGAWSDKIGRKLPLLIALFGRLYYAVMMTVIVTQKMWPVESIIYAAVWPFALTGSDVVIMAATFTYLVDITKQENMTLRITILEVCFFSAFPCGLALGNYIFSKLTNHSYLTVYGIYIFIQSLCIIYTCIRLQWRTRENQTTLGTFYDTLTHFFDFSHIINTAKTLGKPRSRNKRAYLITLIFIMGIFTLYRSEAMVVYMYLQLVFNWTFEQISVLTTVDSISRVLIMIFLVPLLSKVVKCKETIIIAIGSLGFIIGRVIYILADAGWLFYVGGVMYCIGPIAGPALKSMVSKMVEDTEKGRALALLSIAENASPVISSAIYSNLYAATIDTCPEAVFYFTLACHSVIVVIILYIHFKTEESDLIETGENRMLR